jgi:hypothetical protein
MKFNTPAPILSNGKFLGNSKVCGASASRAAATKSEGNTTVLNEVTTVPMWTIALPMTAKR